MAENIIKNFPRKLTEEEQKYVKELDDMYKATKECREHITFFVHGKFTNCFICGNKVDTL